MYDNVNDDMTRAEILTFINETKEDLPALGDVNTKANKPDLIASVNEILSLSVNPYTDFTNLNGPEEGSIEDMPFIEDNSFDKLDFDEPVAEDTPEPEVAPEPVVVPTPEPEDPKPANTTEKAYVRRSGNSSTFGRVRR